jgi:hypothetical protein
MSLFNCLPCGAPWHLQVTMVNCKFTGLKLAVRVQRGAQVMMMDCSIDLPSGPALDDAASVVCDCAATGPSSVLLVDYVFG